MGSGHLDAFLLQDYSPPPAEGKDFGSSDSIDLKGLKPVATTSERAKNGKATMTFNPQGASFVALRWTPGSTSTGDEAFEVAEIGASVETTLAMIDPAGRTSATTFVRGAPPGEIPIIAAPSE
jgi:hypothetical protein